MGGCCPPTPPDDLRLSDPWLNALSASPCLVVEYVADHLGHKNIQNTRVYAQISKVFRDLERHPKIVHIA